MADLQSVTYGALTFPVPQGGGGGTGTEYSLAWNEASRSLELSDGTTTQSEELTGVMMQPSYTVSNNDTGGNVVKIGEYVENNTTYGIYEFYYKTNALPNTTTKVFNLTTLLADYTILDFLDASGVTSNGIYIGSGRIDGTNIAVVQQFSKNNKTFTIRTYQDFSGATARVCIKFIGTKNA